MFDILKYNTISFAIRFFLGMVLIKVLSSFLGPEGLGVYGQFVSFIGLVTIFSSGGINDAVIKFTSKYEHSKYSIYKFLKAGWIISIAFIFLSCIFMIVFSKLISYFLFNNESYYSYIILISFVTPFLISSNFFISVYTGRGLAKSVISKSIYAVIVITPCIILSTILWGLHGALIALILSQSLMFFFLNEYKKKQYYKKYFYKLNISKEITSYAPNIFISLVNIISVHVTLLMVKSLIIHKLSIKDLGIYEGLSRISSLYLTVISSTLNLYILPKFSKYSTFKMINIEIYKTYKFLLPLMIIALLFIFLTRNIIIDILFNESFRPISTLLFWQLIGDFFRSLSFVFSVLILAKGFAKTHILTEAIFSLSFYIISTNLIESYKLNSITIAYAISTFLCFIAYLSFHYFNKKKYV